MIECRSQPQVCIMIYKTYMFPLLVSIKSQYRHWCLNMKSQDRNFFFALLSWRLSSIHWFIVLTLLHFIGCRYRLSILWYSNLFFLSKLFQQPIFTIFTRLDKQRENPNVANSNYSNCFSCIGIIDIQSVLTWWREALKTR